MVSARRAACQTPPPEEQLGKLRASNGQERKGQRSRVLICSRRGFSDGLYFLRRALVSCDEEMTDGGMKRLTIAMISHVAARFPSVFAVMFHVRDNAKEVRIASSVQSCRKSRRLSFPNGVVEMRPVASLRAGPGKPARQSSASARTRARQDHSDEHRNAAANSNKKQESRKEKQPERPWPKPRTHIRKANPAQTDAAPAHPAARCAAARRAMRWRFLNSCPSSLLPPKPEESQPHASQPASQRRPPVRRTRVPCECDACVSHGPCGDRGRRPYAARLRWA